MALDRRPSLCIVDLAGGDAAQWKFVATVRGAKALKNIPVLLIANAALSDEDTQRAITCCVQGILVRPMDAGTLENEIGRALRNA